MKQLSLKRCILALSVLCFTMQPAFADSDIEKLPHRQRIEIILDICGPVLETAQKETKKPIPSSYLTPQSNVAKENLHSALEKLEKLCENPEFWKEKYEKIIEGQAVQPDEVKLSANIATILKRSYTQWEALRNSYYKTLDDVKDHKNRLGISRIRQGLEERNKRLGITPSEASAEASPKISPEASSEVYQGTGETEPISIIPDTAEEKTSQPDIQPTGSQSEDGLDALLDDL